jgi:diadenosine tetraphosphatase ApaH/serine/threonine PP2A family protein phosphatase
MEEEVDPSRIMEVIRQGFHLPEHAITSLVAILQDILYQECNCLELPVPITICGDTHGQLFDLLKLFQISGEVAENNSLVYLFLGDYVDRGYYSLETFVYLAALKVKFPNRIYLLRGNHESRQVNHMYGFYNDCVQVYGHMGIWALCNEIFDLLPIAAVVGNHFFCVHGGLSKHIETLERICLLQRRVELPNEGALCDFCWSDPDDDVQNWEINARGAGWLFGKPQVERFLQRNGLKMIVRSHQLAMEGYQWHFDHQCITVWSAPNYMYRAGNKASVMVVDEEKQFDLRIFEADPDSSLRKPEDAVMDYFA